VFVEPEAWRGQAAHEMRGRHGHGSGNRQDREPSVAPRSELAVTTVLLVDDEPGVRFAVSEVLCDRGYRVVSASSGPEALAALDGVDVVVTDLSMPGMDGLELVAQIAARAPALPVIVLTAHGSDNLVRIASSRGACGCLSKPFDIDEIARVVERALAGVRPV
jgi:CheY-like chemotaxis protein